MRKGASSIIQASWLYIKDGATTNFEKRKFFDARILLVDVPVSHLHAGTELVAGRERCGRNHHVSYDV